MLQFCSVCKCNSENVSPADINQFYCKIFYNSLYNNALTCAKYVVFILGHRYMDKS